MAASDDEIPSTSFEEVGGRGCRAKKKQTDPAFCPVCSVTIRPQEIESHYSMELDKLGKVFNKCKQNGKNSCMSPPSVNGASSENNAESSWQKFQKVRSNRQNRQKNKSRKRRHDQDEIICPVCSKPTNEDINIHVERCLRKSEAHGSDSDENIDVEGYEEYEWAGESRVRTTTLLGSNLSSLGTSISRTDEDEDLVVDGDDTHLYGMPQYTEKDIIPPGSIDKDSDALRKAVIGTDLKKSPANTSKDSGDENELGSGDPIVEALKSRIRELENKDQSLAEVYKCLICMERYRTPVISVCCWHVHCEVCWLQTLGAKKLCPQCNMITSPTDLRRIYM